MRLRKKRLSYLSVLITELFLLTLASLMHENLIVYILFVVALFFVFGSVITAIWNAFIPRMLATIAGIVAFATGFAWAIPGLDTRAVDIAFTICAFSYACFALIAIVSMLKHVFEIENVTIDRIIGSICIYFLIGMFFAFIYAGIDLLEPNTFNFVGTNTVTLDSIKTYLYFSYTTLTTLGYGDITPLIPAARLVSMLEAIIGQVYLVIMVAMLVGVHVSMVVSSHRAARDGNTSRENH
jgi:hypothetical protein